MTLRRALPHLAVAALVLSAWGAGALERVERASIDARFRLLRARRPATTTVVAIDAKSLRAFQVWPWSRQLHASLLDELLADGAERVAFDVDFSSRSEPADDAEWAGALARARGKVVLPVVRAAPLPPFAEPSALGAIRLHPETDGLVRRYGTGDEPSFADAILGRTDPTPPFRIDFAIDPASIDVVSYVDVLTGSVDPERFRGRKVIVGATAAELGDRVPVPVHASIPGPVLQALAVTAIESGRALRRSSAWEVVLGALLAALVASVLFEGRTWRLGLLSLGVSISVLLLGALAAQGAAPLLLDVVPAGATLIAGFVVAVARGIDREAIEALAQRLRLRRVETLMERVVASSLDAVVVADARGRVLRANPAAERLFGRAEGKAIASLVRGEEGVRADGSSFPVEVVTSPLPEGEGSVHVVRDVTERRELEGRLRLLADHDPLTGLPNRRRLFRELEEALQRGEASFLLLDLDRFKDVNDALGHAVGDRLLEEVARRLREAGRPEETVGRLGGDEFGVVVPAAHVAADRARALVAAVSAPCRLEGLDLVLEASAGVASGIASAATLVQRADVAMYAAKRAGAGVLAYRPEMDASTARQLELRGELEGAIERGELFLVYQPKVDARDGRTVGAEALVRWRHPRHGFVPPSQFVPMAEHSGLIRPLTRWVLETTIAQAAAWRLAGYDLTVSVNLSARNLREGDLVPFLREALARHGVPGESLVAEITEGVAMEDGAGEALEAIASLGIEISIDDFGTGYSSLAYLGRLPAREVKIDRSFVVELTGGDARATRLVHGIVDMAHGLGLRVVAEGVETLDVWQILRGMGCDLGQGYGLGRPVEAGGLELLRSARGTPAALR